VFAIDVLSIMPHLHRVLAYLERNFDDGCAFLRVRGGGFVLSSTDIYMALRRDVSVAMSQRAAGAFFQRLSR